MAEANVQQSAKSPNILVLLWSAAIIIMWLIVSLASFIVFTLGMLPTLVAYFCDRTEHRYALYCVGGLNLSGTFPFLLKLIEDHTVANAMEIMGDVFSIGIIYSAAGFGWLMFLTVPPVISSFLTVLAESRKETLLAIQQQIVDEWGNEVTEGEGVTFGEIGARALYKGPED